MDRIAKALLEHDEAYADMATLLFGDGADELISKMSASDKKARRDRTMQNVAIGTNVVGSVAGPAALYSAVRHRREGGIPRDIADGAGSKLSGSKKPRLKRLGNKLNSGVKTLNQPGNRKAKIAAGAAGATMVGLQAVNWGGDVLSAKLIGDQKKKDSAKVAKGYFRKMEPGPSDLNVKRAVTRVALTGAEKSGAKLKTKAKKSGYLKPLTIQKSESMDVIWEGEFSKVDEDKRQVFGYASVVELDGAPVVDRQGDHISIEEIEKAAYDYVMKSRKGGDMHRREGDLPFHGADMIESFLITDEKIEKMNLPPETPRGWWVGFKVHDDDLWQEVKKGNRTGFSIHGKGNRVSKVLA